MTTDAFVARQAIVDRRHRLVAYELLFRTADGGGLAAGADGVGASLAVVSNALLDMGTTWLLGDRLAFVNMGAAALLSELPAILPKDRIVVEILEDVDATPEVLARVQDLRAQGCRFALDDYDHRPAVRALLPLCDYVKLDVLALDAARLRDVARSLRAHPLRLVAEKVETRAHFDACAGDFDLFQGYYFARPETFATRVLEPAQAALLQLMERVGRGAEVDEVEALFRRDVALTVKPMHYVNAAGFGLARPARSLRHVLALLGQRPLYRWLTVLLATSGRGDATLPLARTAITRGRVAELLGARLVARDQRDELFVAGVFTLLDAMLGVPMADVLARLPLPAAVADALLRRAPPYGPILDLVEALESQEVATIGRRAAALGLDPADVSRDHLEALAWVERLGLD
ncbi:MAG: EAL domain-containing protein [Burkholderiales bacterium]|nr:EAL domain-containing protein [Burkholderiales bacterium]